MLRFLRGLKNNGVTITKHKTLMSILIQPEKSLVSGNKREFDILNIENKLHEPMKSFAFVKIQMETAQVKILISILRAQVKILILFFLTKGSKVLFYSNHDERDVLRKLSTAIILSSWLERVSITSHC